MDKYTAMRVMIHDAALDTPAPGIIQGAQEVILDVLAKHCAPEDRREVFKGAHRSLVEQLVQATFRETDPDARTPEQILVRVGMLCELRNLLLNTGAAELLHRLNALLRGGESFSPLD